MNQIKEFVVGGVDTHKDIHVAAVVNELNQVLSSESFPTTRYGYKKMLMWMSSFGRVSRVGIECSGTYGLGLLRYMQSSGVDVLEVTSPDNSDRRRRRKNDTLMLKMQHMMLLANYVQLHQKQEMVWLNLLEF
ncbi:hypothetical protein N482_05125 [Pseudoalteromonas luteoviolacea NCIMB 1942]|uniref:Transposase IS110-like N-terminal domain-containing protein n=1 Tax=Pseudoalteromonas luteoviolacea NCIMB 1942 TaxID=1365253 RepID=A0A167GCU3_9GAMM|nr:hypothetical protein N482_05125 [Pseudoalteromonas luteoviolacea NCIMB 1942]